MEHMIQWIIVFIYGAIDDLYQICLFHVQVTTYNEDFKAERSDRERAQATIQEQKDEVVGIKQMVVVMVSEPLNS